MNHFQEKGTQVNHTEHHAKTPAKTGLFATLRGRLRGAKGTAAPPLPLISAAPGAATDPSSLAPQSLSKSSRLELRASRRVKAKDAASAMERLHCWVHERIAFARTPAFALLGGALIALSSLATAPSAQAEPCPNEAIREAQGTFAKALPDCRAYELVSPGSTPKLTNDGSVSVSEYASASTTGSRFAYLSYYPTDNAHSSSFFYLAIRGEGGWSTQSVAPQDSPTEGGINGYCSQELNFSPDLSKSVLGDGHQGCPSAEEELAPGAPSGPRNLFLREDATAGPYRLVDVTPETALPNDAYFVAASADLSHIVFTDEAQLTPEAPAGASLYEWADGEVHLVTVLPNGEPTQGNTAGSVDFFNSYAQAQHAVSPDGERVYFYSQGNLYLRENATQAQSAVNGAGHCTEPSKACTVQIDESHGPGASGGGSFAAGSADGSKVFFTDQSKLTGDSTAEPGKSDLYEYEVQSGQLTDLTPGGSGAGFGGTSADGSYVYFSSPGVLTGAEENEHHEKAEPGKSNLYLHHAGNTTFVAGDIEGGQVSPNGRFLVFTSREPLTGYDNTPANPEECQIQYPVFGPCMEIFRYGADTGQLSCVSCGPEGSVPTGNNLLAYASDSGGIPAATHPRRQIDDEGRVFFDTKNALVPEDENGARDVYEYGNGQINLISSGTDLSGASFYEAGPSGNDVFFVTAQRLLPSDTNNNNSLYDARAEGGFAEPPPPPECEGEACRLGGTVAPDTSSWATSHFEGPGNPKVTGCKKGFVRRHGHCVKIRKHDKRRHHKRANLNRGGLK